MTADQIVALLARRHSGDVFVSECKTGSSTRGPGCVRLDAWAMPRSWSHLQIVGYEVKVSRADFMQDNKWHRYLDYCHCLYFVCPWGLIAPPELPDHVGLIYANKQGTKLLTKRKAPAREVSIPAELFQYILMSRAEISPPNMNRGMTDREFWENWLLTKRTDFEFGQRVGREIRVCVTEALAKADRADKLMKNYEGIRAFLKSIDINPDSEWQADIYTVRRSIEEAKRAFNPQLINMLRRTSKEAAQAAEELEKIR